MTINQASNYISYIALRSSFSFMKLIPRKVLITSISNLLKVFSYRNDTIFSNLKESFPTKTNLELKAIQSKFYKNLATVAVSQLHGAKESNISYKNIDIVNKLIDKHGSVLLIGSHFSCWEATGKELTKHISTDYQYVAYKRLKNRYIDKYLKKLRSDTKAEPVEMKSLFRKIATNKKSKIKSAYYLIADQYPSSLQNIVEIPFLNQKTRFINGPEKMATILDIPVVFLYINIDSNGLETVQAKVIHEPFTHHKEAKTITKTFAALLEKQIIENPSYWLWSHKRWKNIR